MCADSIEETTTDWCCWAPSGGLIIENRFFGLFRLVGAAALPGATVRSSFVTFSLSAVVVGIIGGGGGKVR